MKSCGPTFVKLGQLLSTRSDIIPEAFVDEFKKLQDEVQPVSFDQIKRVLEQELGGPIENRFSTMSVTPLASASIGQVHEATLITGERVVVKIQRPEIEKIIQNDISLLAFIAKALERYVPEIRIFNPSVIVDEFFRTLVFELDYKIEANNMKKISENLAKFEDVVIPRVYKELTTTKVLTLEKLEGIRVNDFIALANSDIDKKEIVKLGARAFLKSVMIDGLFHGDLHGGNLFILPGNKLGVIDFGIVGRLSMKARDQLANMVMALITEDYEALC
ncbi:MAG: AarF/ABC1/UbiB kinase family protein [Xanthomonadaceae bacterium]|nr:AarF/ABC1/UbiB kinase family protein [Xanthomonadaceae bacterium]